MSVMALIAVMALLGPVAAIRTASSGGHVASATAPQTQADQVSVIKVEGMT